jgi:hypothetical protein
VYAQSSNSIFLLPEDIYVESVNHTINVLYDTSIAINDTIRVSTSPGKSVLLHNFPLGFPHVFKYNLVYCAAFNLSSHEELKVELDVGLGRPGYYGVNVVFPETLELSDGKFFEFRVVFVFSGVTTMSMVEVPVEQFEKGRTPKNKTLDEATISFPLYPSLLVNASTCNVVFILLPRTTCNNLQELPGFEKKAVGEYESYYHTKSSLEKFAYEIRQFKYIPNPAETPELTKLDINERDLKIELKEPKQLFVTDSIRITNTHIYELQTFQMRIPFGATDLKMWDDVGNVLTPALINRSINLYSVNLKKILQPNFSVKLKITYFLPWEQYVTQIDWQQFSFSFRIGDFDFVVKRMSINILLPENAKLIKFKAPSNTPVFALQREPFQEQATFTIYNATPFNKLNINFDYHYSLFWASFRPTLWVSSLLALVCVVVLIWRRQAPTVQVPTISVSPKLLKDFVDSYEKKIQITSKLELIEERASKGKLSRREYKIRKRMLESEFSSLNKKLAEMKEKLRSMGARYAEVMKQIEFAETELEEVKAGEMRVKARYSRGELTLDAYRKLLEDYAKRKERAETAINGALMSLREGIV